MACDQRAAARGLRKFGNANELQLNGDGLPYTKKGGSAALVPQKKHLLADIHAYQCLTAAGAGASVTGGGAGAASSSDSGSVLRSSAISNTLSIHFTG